MRSLLVLAALATASSAVAADQLYMTTLDSDVYAMAFDGSGTVALFNDGQSTSGIAVDVDRRKLFLSDWDDTTRALRSASLEGQGVASVVAGESTVNTIALDPVNQHLFYTNWFDNVIRRADFDGSNVVDIVTSGIDPEGIAVDPLAGQLYWGNRFQLGIMRSNLDGSSLTTVVDRSLSLGSDIRQVTLDLAHGKMYWADAGLGTFERANLDGTAQEVLYTGGFPWGIVVHEGTLYMSDISFTGVLIGSADGLSSITANFTSFTPAYLAIGPARLTIHSTHQPTGILDIRVSGATPNSTVAVGWSTATGETAVPGCPDGWSVALQSGRVLATLPTDADGNASMSRVPPSGLDAYVVAYDSAMCDGSAPYRVITP